MTDTGHETGAKFDVAPDFTVPDLSALDLGAERVSVDVDTVALRSTYYDTADGDLMRFGLTVRRRIGDVDTRWELAVPTGAGGPGDLLFAEYRPGDGQAADGELPSDLLQSLAPFVRGRAIGPSIRLDIVRTRHRIHDAGGGELIAEIARDDVRAVGLGAVVRAPRWHEVEVRPGCRPIRWDPIATRLVEAGAVASTSRSKLTRARFGIGNEGLGARTSAGAVLLDYVAIQADAVVGGHFAIEQDAEDSVHRTRVACRRLRSTLRTFEFCFDLDQASAFEDELKWYSGALGEVRDRQVLRRRIAAALESLPPELVVGPAATHIDDQLVAELTGARAALLAEHRGARYAALLAEISRWRHDPPFTAAAGRPAQTLAAAVDEAGRTLTKRLRMATTPAGSDEDMHRARKAGQRTRYATEAAGSGSRTARDAERLRHLLGEFQDSVVAAELLQRLGADAYGRGEDTFTYGVLVAEERRRAETVRRKTRKSD